MKLKKLTPPLPATRSEAKALKLPRYLGSPCFAGHTEGRLTSNGSCCRCHREKVAGTYAAARDQRQAEWAARKPEPIEIQPLPDWMSQEPPKPKRKHRKPGEAFIGESDIWHPY
jgi:hypothetical protein